MNTIERKLMDRITTNPDILGGKPTIRGQRFLVRDVIELIQSGMSEEDILQQHPLLEQEDLQAALLYWNTNNQPF